MFTRLFQGSNDKNNPNPFARNSWPAAEQNTTFSFQRNSALSANDSLADSSVSFLRRSMSPELFSGDGTSCFSGSAGAAQPDASLVTDQLLLQYIADAVVQQEQLANSALNPLMLGAGASAGLILNEASCSNGLGSYVPSQQDFLQVQLQHHDARHVQLQHHDALRLQLQPQLQHLESLHVQLQHHDPLQMQMQQPAMQHHEPSSMLVTSSTDPSQAAGLVNLALVQPDTKYFVLLSHSGTAAASGAANLLRVVQAARRSAGNMHKLAPPQQHQHQAPDLVLIPFLPSDDSADVGALLVRMPVSPQVSMLHQAPTMQIDAGSNPVSTGASICNTLLNAPGAQVDIVFTPLSARTALQALAVGRANLSSSRLDMVLLVSPHAFPPGASAGDPNAYFQLRIASTAHTLPNNSQALLKDVLRLHQQDTQRQQQDQHQLQQQQGQIGLQGLSEDPLGAMQHAASLAVQRQQQHQQEQQQQHAAFAAGYAAASSVMPPGSQRMALPSQHVRSPSPGPRATIGRGTSPKGGMPQLTNSMLPQQHSQQQHQQQHPPPPPPPPPLPQHLQSPQQLQPPPPPPPPPPPLQQIQQQQPQQQPPQQQPQQQQPQQQHPQASQQQQQRLSRSRRADYVIVTEETQVKNAAGALAKVLGRIAHLGLSCPVFTEKRSESFTAVVGVGVKAIAVSRGYVCNEKTGHEVAFQPFVRPIERQVDVQDLDLYLSEKKLVEQYSQRPGMPPLLKSMENQVKEHTVLDDDAAGRDSLELAFDVFKLPVIRETPNPSHSPVKVTAHSRISVVSSIISRLVAEAGEVELVTAGGRAMHVAMHAAIQARMQQQSAGFDILLLPRFHTVDTVSSHGYESVFLRFHIIRAVPALLPGEASGKGSSRYIMTPVPPGS